MSKTYTLVNQKGGVGKTTTAINLGAYLAYYGQRVLIVDVDPQANATSCLGVDKYSVRGGTYEVILGAKNPTTYILHNPRLKISLLPASPALAGAEVELVDLPQRESRLRTVLEPLHSRYDYILVDCPPSLGLLTVNGIMAAREGVIIPVQCEYLALEGLSQLTQTLSRIRESLYPALQVRGLLMTMYDGRTNLSSDVAAELRQHFPGQVFETVIPRNVRLAEAPSYGLPISSFAPASSGAKGYEELAREVLAGDGIHIPVFQE